jgi:hypothetical protein
MTTTTEVPQRIGLVDLELPPHDALEVAGRLRRIAELPQPTPADQRTAARLDYIAEALEHAAAG